MGGAMHIIIIINNYIIYQIICNNNTQSQSAWVEPEWNSLRIRARGRGVALLQLHSSFRATRQHQLKQPPLRAFTVEARAVKLSQHLIRVSPSVFILN